MRALHFWVWGSNYVAAAPLPHDGILPVSDRPVRVDSGLEHAKARHSAGIIDIDSPAVSRARDQRQWGYRSVLPETGLVRGARIRLHGEAVADDLPHVIDPHGHAAITSGQQWQEGE